MTPLHAVTAMSAMHHILLIDPDSDTRAIFAQRLRAQGFAVDEAVDAVSGAEIALAAPPSAVIADLWMPGISGVQLCRLFRAEPATSGVPVVLRAERDDPRSRFWARQAGAKALVSKGRMGELVRTLSDVMRESPPSEGFFLQLGREQGQEPIRDRIAHHLDRALFESVVSGELRALATASSFEQLFDSLSQFVVQLVDYRWFAIATRSPQKFAIHAHRRASGRAEGEARTLLSVPDGVETSRIFDEDAVFGEAAETTLVHEVRLGSTVIAEIALSLPDAPPSSLSRPGAQPAVRDTDVILPILTRELGAVIRLSLLVQETKRLATNDMLTGLLNRRAFVEAMCVEKKRSERSMLPSSILLIDLDHFKSINDTRGHAVGDAVLASVARTLRANARGYDVVARWGGEEFIVGLPCTDASTAEPAAERLRRALEELIVMDGRGENVPITASIGVAEREHGESLEATIDRADRALYAAKGSGRNRVCVDQRQRPSAQPDSQVTSVSHPGSTTSSSPAGSATLRAATHRAA